MLKVKRFNALEYAKQEGIHYTMVDLIRITSVEKIVNALDNSSKDEVIETLLTLMKHHLEKLIVEVE